MNATASPALTPPPGNPRFPLLDGVRAIAALSVVGVHLSDSTGFSDRAVIGELTARLNVGVAVFFVLSGFLLMRPFLAAAVADRPRPSIGRYLRRRVLRIVPAYWFALLCCGALGLIGFAAGWWRYAFFLQVFDRTTVLSGIQPAWTLAVEVQFYVTLPLIALLLAGSSGAGYRRHVAVIAIVGLAGLLWRALVLTGGPTSLWLVQAPTHMAWFAGGMGLALLSVAIEHRAAWALRTRARLDHPLVLWTAAVAVYALVAFALGLPTTPFAPTTAAQNMAQHVGFLLVALLVTAPAVLAVHRPSGRRPSAVERLLGHRIVAWLGLVSYGIFLWHHPLMTWLERDAGVVNRVPGSPLVTLTVLTLAASIAAAAVSYYVVERPFLMLKEPRRRAAAPSSAG